MKKSARFFTGILISSLLAFGVIACKTNDDDSHTHVYDTENWRHDATQHFHACTHGSCKAVIDAENHIWDDGDFFYYGDEESDGETMYTCTVCGKTKTETTSIFYSVPSNKDGTPAASDATTVYFGVFPRSVLSETAGVTVDETETFTIGGNTYYKGSDGNYYAKCLENACKNNEGIYSDGTTPKTSDQNSYRYFKLEPVEWKVLSKTFDYDGDTGTKTGWLLMAAEEVYSGVPFNESGLSDYDKSQIRAYLNGLSYEDEDEADNDKWLNKGFLNTAFTSAARAKIVTTVVDNSYESTAYRYYADSGEYAYGSNGNDLCADTNDKIFLLSQKEATTEAYGFSADGDEQSVTSSRIRAATDYAMANYAYQEYEEDDGAAAYYVCDWYLRSPYNSYDENCFVSEVDFMGSTNGGIESDADDLGIVPALVIEF